MTGVALRTPVVLAILSAWFSAATPAVFADEADAVGARANCTRGQCTISATVRHADSGWEHYADHWRVLQPDGREIARRVLHHPHVDEQPFTRGLGQIQIPPGVEFVIIEAHDSRHGYGGRRFRLNLQ